MMGCPWLLLSVRLWATRVTMACIVRVFREISNYVHGILIFHSTGNGQVHVLGLCSRCLFTAAYTLPVPWKCQRVRYAWIECPSAAYGPSRASAWPTHSADQLPGQSKIQAQGANERHTRNYSMCTFSLLILSRAHLLQIQTWVDSTLPLVHVEFLCWENHGKTKSSRYRTL